MECNDILIHKSISGKLLAKSPLEIIDDKKLYGLQKFYDRTIKKLTFPTILLL